MHNIFMLGIEQKTVKKQVFMPRNLPSTLPITPGTGRPPLTHISQDDRAHSNGRNCRTGTQNMREEKIYERDLKMNKKT